MPNNDLKILITAGLNHGKSIGEINTAIKGIQQKVDKLRLNVEVNDKVLASLNNFSKQMKNIGESARNAGKYVEEITNPDGSKIKRTFFDGIKEDFKQTETAAKKTKVEVGQLVDELDDYGKKIKEIQRLNAKGETIGTTSVFKNNEGILTSVNADKKGRVTSSQIIDNIEQIEKAQQNAIAKVEKAQQKAIDTRKKIEENYNQWWAQALKEREIKEKSQIDAIEKARLQSMNKTQQDRLEAEQKQAQAINKNIDQTHKQKEAEKSKIAILKQQLSLYKQQQSLNVQNARRRYDGLIDNKALDGHLARVNQLSHTTPKVQHQMREFAMGFKQIETNAKTAAGALDTGNKSALSFGSAMKTALIKFPIWIASASLIYAP